MLDYSERRPVSKNRPRKQVGVVFMALVAGAVTVAFGLGVLTGWYFFRSVGHGAAKQSVAAGGNQNAAPATLQPDAAVKPQEPALTFYETLSKGNRAVIGSGLNPPKTPEPVPAKSAPHPLPAKSASPPAPAAKPEVPAEPDGQSKEAAKAPAKAPESPPAAKVAEGKGKFLVQVASMRSKKEAEAVRDRLAAGGVAAYLVESSIPDKGTWFRVRVGRHLDQQTAHDLAAKVGKGAIIIPE